MKVAEIGDNCIDLYERLGKKYPTGNVVDTGVNLKKLGIDVSIISTTGTYQTFQRNPWCYRLPTEVSRDGAPQQIYK